MSIRFTNTVGQYAARSTANDYASPYTVMMWVRIDTAVAHGAMWYAASTATPSGFLPSDMLSADADGLTLRLLAADNSTYALQAGGTLVAGVWHHVAVVRTDSSTLLLYLDGSLSATVTKSIVGRSASIGEFLGRNNGTQYFAGSIAAYKSWPAALSAAEVAREMPYSSPVRRDATTWATTFIGATLDNPVLDGLGQGSWATFGTPVLSTDPSVTWSEPGTGRLLLQAGGRLLLQGGGQALLQGAQVTPFTGSGIIVQGYGSTFLVTQGYGESLVPISGGFVDACYSDLIAPTSPAFAGAVRYSMTTTFGFGEAVSVLISPTAGFAAIDTGRTTLV